MFVLIDLLLFDARSGKDLVQESEKSSERTWGKFN